jgi:hypothetical protein
VNPSRFDVKCVLFFFILLFVIQNIYAKSPDWEDHVRGKNKNVVSLYLGDTNRLNRNYFTYGFEYHRITAMPIGPDFIIEDIPHNEEGTRTIEAISLLKGNILHHVTVGFGPGLEFTKNMNANLFGRF